MGSDTSINTDGATFEEENACGIGVIIRDSGGRFVEAKTMKFTGSTKSLRAEIMDAKEVLSLAKAWGIRGCDLRGGCQNLVG